MRKFSRVNIADGSTSVKASKWSMSSLPSWKTVPNIHACKIVLALAFLLAFAFTWYMCTRLRGSIIPGCSSWDHLIKLKVLLFPLQGVVTSAASLIQGVVHHYADDYKGCVQLAVSRLSRIVTSSYTDLQDYTYYFVPAPWLCVKLLKLLQLYPPPGENCIRVISCTYWPCWRVIWGNIAMSNI